VNPDPALLAWITRTDHEPVDGWAPVPPRDELRCHPDLVARLAEVARAVPGTRRVFVAGCPVIHHPSGVPLATAAGTKWFTVRSNKSPGALQTSKRTPGLGSEWVELDPWAPDTAFAKALDGLRHHVVRAFALATSER
jgi:hypothetical protein